MTVEKIFFLQKSSSLHKRSVVLLSTISGSNCRELYFSSNVFCAFLLNSGYNYSMCVFYKGEPNQD